LSDIYLIFLNKGERERRGSMMPIRSTNKRDIKEMRKKK
jgi:hypothetical protein